MTRSLPPEVRKRLTLMLPLLSSPNAGECAAAAGAIGRLLKAHELDWHDLTAAIAEPAGEARSQPAPPSKWKPAPESKWRNLPPEEVRAMVATVYAGRVHLDARAKAFLEGQLARAKYGRVLFTNTQWDVLMDLVKQAEAT
jgi:hypothetical protein